MTDTDTHRNRMIALRLCAGLKVRGKNGGTVGERPGVKRNSFGRPNRKARAS